MQYVGAGQLSEAEAAFYRRVMSGLSASGVPYLVGGAYAFARYTGIVRHTKDLDLFINACDWELVKNAMSKLDYSVELTFPHWLGKAFFGDNFIDIIFGSGNGSAPVDDLWFSRSVSEQVLDIDVRLVPPEEMIWQKSFIMERERFDGADVAHLIRACSDTLDWEHLLRRFDTNYRVLLSHLILFGFIYPGETEKVPARVMESLIERLRETGAKAESDVCGGTVLSRAQYLVDIEDWGYQDARVHPRGKMSKDDIVHWTAAIDR